MINIMYMCYMYIDLINEVNLIDLIDPKQEMVIPMQSIRQLFRQYGTYFDPVFIEFRNLPCSRLRRYTSSLEKEEHACHWGVEGLIGYPTHKKYSSTLIFAIFAS